MKELWPVIGSVLAIIIGLWKYFRARTSEKQKQAEQARKDLDNAKENDDPSSFLDGFGRVR